MPVNHVEVLTRIKTLLRRCQSYDRAYQGQLWLGDLEVDFETNSIKVNGRLEKLTKTEIAVLGQLVANPNKVVARTYLIDQVWGFWDARDTRTVDTHIKKIRRILASLDTSWEIVTVTRVGFRLSKKLGTSSVCSA